MDNWLFQYSVWVVACTELIHERTANRLDFYPLFRSRREWLATAGLRSALREASALHLRALLNRPVFDSLFPDLNTFGRWLAERSWRRVLRLVFRLPTVTDALALLPIEQRRLLTLRFDTQFNDREIARVLGIADNPIAEVRLRSEAAVAALRAALGQQGQVVDDWAFPLWPRD